MSLSEIDAAIVDGHDRDAMRLLIDQNLRSTKALAQFVRWYERYERDWTADEYRDSVEFFDLRDAYDAAKGALK
ncbi:hypothetical protein [Bradyrhizobium sp. S3.7.6]